MESGIYITSYTELGDSPWSALFFPVSGSLRPPSLVLPSTLAGKVEFFSPCFLVSRDVRQFCTRLTSLQITDMISQCKAVRQKILKEWDFLCALYKKGNAFPSFSLHRDSFSLRVLNPQALPPLRTVQFWDWSQPSRQDWAKRRKRKQGFHQPPTFWLTGFTFLCPLTIMTGFSQSLLYTPAARFPKLTRSPEVREKSEEIHLYIFCFSAPRFLLQSPCKFFSLKEPSGSWFFGVWNVFSCNQWEW